ncbi:helix-turn-helix transcriptional regulator [Actinoplanes derwentensis]|nr:WYL domain-containing protein [Actinoplanes derwentensis]
MVLLLQSRGTVTAAELAIELGVSERTVYRDIGELGAAGVPVYAEQGRLGGYRLVDGYRTRLTGLSPDEAEALFLLGLDGPARDMGLSELLATAALKVSASLPAGLRKARATQRFHLDVPGWFHDGEPPPMLTALVGAVWQDLAVTLRYRRADAEEPPAVQAAAETAEAPDDQGWIAVRLPVESVEVAYHQLLRLGPEVEVLKPESLRERMRAAARRLHDRYQR